MSLSSFGRGRDGESPGGSAPAPARSAASGGLSAFIDQGSDFEGKLSFRDTVRIDGHFRGEISSENTLIVGETGEIEATIRSKIVAVSGVVMGDVHADEKLVLHKTGRVEGTIETPSLAVEEGAVICGQVNMPRPGARPTAASLKAIEGRSGTKSGTKAEAKSDATRETSND